MAGLDTTEIDAINSTEQENVGQKMDVYQSLKTLKDVERTCITLFYMEDLSIDKIAGITGIPAGTVKKPPVAWKDKLATYLNKMVMTEIDNDKLLLDFFTENRQEIADRIQPRVMHHLPDRSNRLARITNAFVMAVGRTFVSLGGPEAAWGTIREGYSSA